MFLEYIRIARDTHSILFGVYADIKLTLNDAEGDKTNICHIII